MNIVQILLDKTCINYMLLPNADVNYVTDILPISYTKIIASLNMFTKMFMYFKISKMIVSC